MQRQPVVLFLCRLDLDLNYRGSGLGTNVIQNENYNRVSTSSCAAAAAKAEAGLISLLIRPFVLRLNYLIRRKSALSLYEFQG